MTATWFESFALAAVALVTAVWTLKTKFFRNNRVDAVHHKESEGSSLYLTCSNSHFNTDDSSDLSYCVKNEYSGTDHGQSETAEDLDLVKSDEEIIAANVKDVTSVNRSGYGDVQENTSDQNDSGVTKGDSNSDSLITDGSFGEIAIIARDVESTDAEGNKTSDSRIEKKRCGVTDHHGQTCETCNDSELGKSWDQEILENVSIGHDSYGDSRKNTSDSNSKNDSGVTNGNSDSDSLTTDDFSSGEIAIAARSRVVKSTEDERNNSETEWLKKTYFTDRRQKLRARRNDDDYDFIKTETVLLDWNLWTSELQDGAVHASKNDCEDSWESTRRTADRFSGTCFDQYLSTTTESRVNSNDASSSMSENKSHSTSSASGSYSSKGTKVIYCRHPQCKPQSDSDSFSNASSRMLAFGSPIEFMPSPIYPDDSSISMESNIQFVKDYTAESLVDTTPPDCLNKSFIETT